FWRLASFCRDGRRFIIFDGELTAALGASFKYPHPFRFCSDDALYTYDIGADRDSAARSTTIGINKTI
ncbi:MAG: hypothetical protein KAH12_08125, partial [Anaerolineales bacterium]|nr:hypothetical protein [Anaerolineales bacterium]